MFGESDSTISEIISGANGTGEAHIIRKIDGQNVLNQTVQFNNGTISNITTNSIDLDALKRSKVNEYEACNGTVCHAMNETERAKFDKSMHVFKNNMKAMKADMKKMEDSLHMMGQKMEHEGLHLTENRQGVDDWLDKMFGPDLVHLNQLQNKMVPMDKVPIAKQYRTQILPLMDVILI
uniref:Uncharacterized protein n=1 Tax=Strombidium rassoulzadegani TaxID=1082188 RepID=A0A7S3CSD9_9SPIT|mmetsp:Transcript_6799/g.11443  ORF Transcript_6799/g.11443 Transcript_6799/m.11443 type:complete len:179 (+) Transcript_6799:57-593(+)|eukprot:CAMPEP_0168612534 /NCGR_PEP_ID=MMETSP0449_2-20121227/2968_1 /TAXON_ID=1082188 /ORGANISM="Strombidium rassoulzadegani, Strain ras09" /LENGTH=178 /DNA_ID=CAMNT_0008653105 /DNA_START=38 /DNA_END=574 /DNA_ORIENTATION=+